MKTTSPIQITAKEIQETEYFKQLTPVLQKLTLQKKNRDEIQHGMNVSRNIGFENWKKQTGTRYVNQMIVKEIIDSSLKTTQNK